MSVAYAETDAPAEDTPEVEIDPREAELGEEEGSGEEDEGAAKRKDWEKEAHNLKGATARERSRRRAAERRASDLEARLERLETQRQPQNDELMDLIAQLRDDDDDPVGDIAATKKALKLFRARQLAEQEETGRQTTLERQFEKLRTAMVESERDFADDHPDYHDAAKFYRQQRTEELEDAGYTGTNLQRKLADDLYGVVRMAVEGGQDPAERVYALAKRRGFKTGMTAAERKLATVQRANESGVRPTAKSNSPGNLSWDDVAKLDGPARDKAWAKLRERERSRR